MGRLLKPTTEAINIDSLNLENGTYVIGTGMSGTKPFEYGILIQFKRYTYTIQIAIDIDSAAIAKRQTNNERWPNWDFYVTKSDLTPSVYGIPKPSSINGMDNITIWEVRAFKSGKVVCLTLNIDGVLSANTDWKMLFTLPKEYRPSEGSVIVNYITQYGKQMLLDISTGGEVRIVCPSGEGILKGDWICRQCITYVTNS